MKISSLEAENVVLRNKVDQQRNQTQINGTVCNQFQNRAQLEETDTNQICGSAFVVFKKQQVLSDFANTKLRINDCYSAVVVV